jgi:molecular chaperone GrpE
MVTGGDGDDDDEVIIIEDVEVEEELAAEAGDGDEAGDDADIEVIAEESDTEVDEDSADAELSDSERLSQENERLAAEYEHLREMYLRKLAEFDNFRKRTEREKKDLEQSAAVGLVREIIPVLDNFERALQHQSETDPNAFRQGVEMIAKQLWDTLERSGLEMVDPAGQPFEPEFHEAVQRVEDTDLEPGTVAWVLAKGYFFCGRLVRPAMVGVAVEPSGSDQQTQDGDNEGAEGVGAS